MVLTECLDMGYYLEAMQLGAADYVEKPLRAVQAPARPCSFSSEAAKPPSFK